MGWGHARSRDLAHWQHCPVALMPTPGGPDGAGCWSGSVVIHEGVPTLMYSGVADMTLYSADDDLPPSDRQRIPQGYYHEFLLEIDQETQCIAKSGDNLMTWEKHAANPVIPAIPPELDLIGFRDPYLWKEADGRWYMLLGSGIKGVGGVALLYRSPDLLDWNTCSRCILAIPPRAASTGNAPTSWIWAGRICWSSPRTGVRFIGWGSTPAINSRRMASRGGWIGGMSFTRPTALEIRRGAG